MMKNRGALVLLLIFTSVMFLSSGVLIGMELASEADTEDVPESVMTEISSFYMSGYVNETFWNATWVAMMERHESLPIPQYHANDSFVVGVSISVMFKGDADYEVIATIKEMNATTIEFCGMKALAYNYITHEYFRYHSYDFPEVVQSRNRLELVFFGYGHVPGLEGVVMSQIITVEVNVPLCSQIRVIQYTEEEVEPPSGIPPLIQLVLGLTLIIIIACGACVYDARAKRARRAREQGKKMHVFESKGRPEQDMSWRSDP